MVWRAIDKWLAGSFADDEYKLLTLVLRRWRHGDRHRYGHCFCARNDTTSVHARADSNDIGESVIHSIRFERNPNVVINRCNILRRFEWMERLKSNEWLAIGITDLERHVFALVYRRWW